MSAGDRLYAANVLSHMSRLTVQIGHGAITDHDRLRHARQAIALARAGHSVTDGKGTPCCPPCYTPSRHAGTPCSAQPTPPAPPCWKPSAATSAPVPATNPPGSPSAPKPHPPPTAAAAGETWG